MCKSNTIEKKSLEKLTYLRLQLRKVLKRHFPKERLRDEDLTVLFSALLGEVAYFAEELHCVPDVLIVMEQAAYYLENDAIEDAASAQVAGETIH